MKIKIRNNCSDFNTYRAARVKSLFNCESGADFALDADLPLEDSGWQIGVVVGPSGSGKTSIGRTIWPDVGIYDGDQGWAQDKPIVECIAPAGGFDDVTGALSAVGLGSVPAWLRPYHALSNGEKFRAGLARVIAEGAQRVIIDEFTSVVDRQIAKVGAGAFSKAWKRGGGQAVLLSCHYDILDWVEPDWVFDTRTGELQRGSLWRRPKFELEVFQTNGSYWPMFEPHHYLKLPRMDLPEKGMGIKACDLKTLFPACCDRPGVRGCHSPPRSRRAIHQGRAPRARTRLGSRHPAPHLRNGQVAQGAGVSTRSTTGSSAMTTGNKTTKEEQDAVKIAQMMREWAIRLVSPAYREAQRLVAQERRVRYLAHIEAGFTEAQAVALCKD